MSEIMSLPIVYTFRRCPYAMRARLAIELCEVNVEYREILLRNKPIQMLKSSPKGTVPVLVLNNQQVIDESLDIIYWTLEKNDLLNLLKTTSLDAEKRLIAINDSQFKMWLDKYKYAVRFPEQTMESYRDNCAFFLDKLNSLLNKNKFLFGNNLGLADIAIFPFIRQFVSVDKIWFDSTKYDYLKSWLSENINSDLYKAIMVKKEVWRGDPRDVF